MGWADLPKHIDALIDGLVRLIYGLVITTLQVATRPVSASLHFSRVAPSPVRSHTYMLASILMAAVVMPSSRTPGQRLSSLAASSSQSFATIVVNVLVVYVTFDLLAILIARSARRGFRRDRAAAMMRYAIGTSVVFCAFDGVLKPLLNNLPLLARVKSESVALILYAIIWMTTWTVWAYPAVSVGTSLLSGDRNRRRLRKGPALLLMIASVFATQVLFFTWVMTGAQAVGRYVGHEGEKLQVVSLTCRREGQIVHVAAALDNPTEKAVVFKDQDVSVTIGENDNFAFLRPEPAGLALFPPGKVTVVELVGPLREPFNPAGSKWCKLADATYLEMSDVNAPLE